MTEHHSKIANRLGIEDESPFLRTNKLTDEIRRAMRAVGLPWRPYVFRSYFDTQQMLGESRGSISHAYAQAFMGHGGDIESVYTLRKAELPPEILEDMRSAYSRVSDLLGTVESKTISENEMVATFNKQFFRLSNWTDEEIYALGDLSTIDNARLQELIAQKNNEKLGANGAGQKVVPISDVKQWLTQGWEFVTKLDEKEAIVRLPK